MIVEFKSNKINFEFIKDVVDMSRTNDDTSEETIDYRIVIKLKNLENGKARIHRYTDFLKKWLESETTTSLEIARQTVKFLNYIYFDESMKSLTSIQDLTINHGVQYLELISESDARYSTKKAERVLTEFYYYLASKKILKNIKKHDFTTIMLSKGRSSIISPFKGTYILPKPKKSNKIHQLEERLILEFIYTALQVCPNIAFGIYMQFFGGLRLSEVVNIEHTNINFKGPNGRNGLVLVLRKNRMKKDRKEDRITSPKKDRNQVVFPVGSLLEDIYTFHAERYKLPECNAVFINRNGDAMSRKSYYYHFNKVKTAFIKRLKEDDSIDLMLYANYLNQKDWSTHIGRGIFSELLANSAGNASEIAVLRGDSDLRSALQYLSDSKRLRSKIVKNLSDMYNKGIEQKLLFSRSPQ